MSKGKINNLEGQKFGRLTVLEITDRRIGGNVVWLCVCECGKQTEVKAGNLQSGMTKSCGCLRSEKSTVTHTTHGKRNTNLSMVWQSMKQRCLNPNNKSFKNYGGRGITICDEWKNDFQAFYDYVSVLPHFGEAGYSLDRINNDGNYEPNNVRWATAKEQSNNKRKWGSSNLI